MTASIPINSLVLLGLSMGKALEFLACNIKLFKGKNHSHKDNLSHHQRVIR